MTSVTQPQTATTGSLEAPIGASTRRSIRAALVSLGLYLGGALYLMARVLPTFDRTIPGSGIAIVDAWQNTWNLWWTHLALTRWQNPYFTDMLFYPAGQSLYLHTLNITNALLTMPVQLVAGPIAAYNAALILGFVLTGFATYLLACYLIGHRGIACAVGALFTFSPFHVSKLVDGHLSWVTVFWIPLLLLCILRSLDDGRWRWRVLAGIVLAGATLTSYYYALFSMIFTALLVLVRLPAAVRAHRWRSELTSVLLIGAIGATLASPVLVPAMREYLSEPQLVPNTTTGTDSAAVPGWDRETATYSADLVDLFFPSPLNAIWGDWANQQHAALRYGWFWTVTPGFGVLALAIVGSYAAWRRVRPWIVLVIVLWVLMLGPRLRIAGIETGIRLPFDFLKVIPGMSLGHRPNHFAIFMLPILMILAGFGMQALFQRGRTGRIALTLLGALIVLEMLVLPIPALPFAGDQILTQIRNQPGAVMDVPNLQRNAPAMEDQMVHGRPIVGGYLARPPAPSAFTETIPWIWQVWWLKPKASPDIVTERPDDGQQALNFYGIGTIIVRKADLKPADLDNLPLVMARVLPDLTPALQDPALDVYNVPPVTNPRPFLYLGDGWYDLERQAAVVWRWMSGSASIKVVNPERAVQPVTLTLSAESYQHTRTLAISLDSQAVASYEIPPTVQTISVELALPPGEHTLRLTSPTTLEPAPPKRDLSLLFTNIDLVAR